MVYVARVYDLVMTHKLDADDFFIHRVQRHCAERKLNFFLIEPLWAEQFLAYLEKGEVTVKVLLNMHSEHHQPEEIYHRLVKAAHSRRAKVIDPPEVAQAAFNKARVHVLLQNAGVKVPPTVIVPVQQVDDFVLTEEQALALGTPFVIKPAMGYGRRGVVMDAQTVVDLRRSMSAWPDAAYLLQQRIVPQKIAEAPAYFRVYYVFGTVWLCWWNCYTDRYRQVSVEEESQLGLSPLRGMVVQIAQLTGMRFFSTEIALTEANELVAIDYVNDQCHLLTQSASPQNGVPDELVAAIALRLVEGAQQLMNE